MGGLVLSNCRGHAAYNTARVRPKPEPKAPHRLEGSLTLPLRSLAKLLGQLHAELFNLFGWLKRAQLPVLPQMHLAAWLFNLC